MIDDPTPSSVTGVDEVVMTPERLAAEARMFARSPVASWQEWLRLEPHEKAALAKAGGQVSIERTLGLLQALSGGEGLERLVAQLDDGATLSASLLDQALQMASGRGGGA